MASVAPIKNCFLPFKLKNLKILQGKGGSKKYVLNSLLVFSGIAHCTYLSQYSKLIIWAMRKLYKFRVHSFGSNKCRTDISLMQRT